MNKQRVVVQLDDYSRLTIEVWQPNNGFEPSVTYTKEGEDWGDGWVAETESGPSRLDPDESGSMYALVNELESIERATMGWLG